MIAGCQKGTVPKKTSSDFKICGREIAEQKFITVKTGWSCPENILINL
jgi:hypothetical protein